MSCYPDLIERRISAEPSLSTGIDSSGSPRNDGGSHCGQRRRVQHRPCRSLCEGRGRSRSGGQLSWTTTTTTTTTHRTLCTPTASTMLARVVAAAAVVVFVLSAVAGTASATDGSAATINNVVNTSRHAGDGEVVRFEYEPALNFSEVLVDERNEQVVVAARDFLFRLGIDNLQKLGMGHWASPGETVSLCRTKGQSSEDCRNYITMLYNQNGTLFACGTNAFSPLCRRYSLDNLSDPLQEKSGRDMSPHSPRINSTSIMTADGDLYVGSRIGFDGNDPALLRSGTRPLLRTPKNEQEYLSNPQFVASFEVGPVVYLFFREEALEYLGCGRAVYSRIARVCKDDTGSALNKLSWATFLKARLNCSLPGNIPFYFSELQGVDYSAEQRTFFASFTTGENSIYGSAVCAYTLDDIERAFQGPLTGKLDRWTKGKSASTLFQCGRHAASSYNDGSDDRGDGVGGYHSHQQSTSSGKATSLATEPVDVLDLKRYQQTFNAVQSSPARPIYHAELERIVQLRTDRVRYRPTATLAAAEAEATGDHGRTSFAQIVFVVTVEGVVKKIVHDPVRNASCVVEQFRPFRPDEKLNRLVLLKRRRALIATTDRGVLKIPLSSCGQHKSELACTGAGDPYCGWSTRERRCTTSPGGNFHTDDPDWKQAEACAADTRVVDGSWSPWTVWKPCELSGQDGEDGECLCRTRRCDSPKPVNGGANCEGSDFQVANCTQHGGWTEWSGWSACSSACGRGYQRRSRSCTNPWPAFGGRLCDGAVHEERGCDGPPCKGAGRPAFASGGGIVGTGTTGIVDSASFSRRTPASPRWGEWGAWSNCSVPCGGGYQLRRRTCTPVETHDCEPGCALEYRTCNAHECSEVRSVSEWTQWLVVTNGLADGGRLDGSGPDRGYAQRRYRYHCVGRVAHPLLLRIVAKKQERQCRQPTDCHEPKKGLAGGVGSVASSLVFNASASVWSEWSEWSVCSTSCGGGVQRRERVCLSGEAATGSSAAAAVDGGVVTGLSASLSSATSSSSSSSSSSAAAAALASATSTADCPPGPAIEERQCSVHSCPTEGWSEWTDWSECDNRGEQHRKRHCIATGDYRRRCLAGVHTRESRICLHEGVSLAVSGGQCQGPSALVLIAAAIVAYTAGVASMILIVRFYNKRTRDGAMMMTMTSASSSSLSTSLQTIPVPKRLGSLPLVPVENNTYVPSSAFKAPSASSAASAAMSGSNLTGHHHQYSSTTGAGGGGGTSSNNNSFNHHFNTLQSHHMTPVKAATIKRSNTFRAQISDDHNF